MLRQARLVLAASGEDPIPGPDESMEGTDWISTKDHDQVLAALPGDLRASANTEAFAFPFWMDVVLGPSAAAAAPRAVRRPPPPPRLASGGS